MPIGYYHKRFYVPHEETEITVLSPERLNFLIYSKEFEHKLTQDFKEVKNVFVFGCSVALRFSDLMNLTWANIEIINGRYYLNVQSKKTQAFTRVKLAPFAIDIINKYKNRFSYRLLPNYNKARLNIKIKKLMHLAGFTEPLSKIRHRRGLPVKVYKNSVNKTDFRFCDAVTTHTMRRTAITTMLSLGMKEQVVRKISGHAPNSKEFYRYVSFAQGYIDDEIDEMHEKLSEKRLNY